MFPIQAKQFHYHVKITSAMVCHRKPEIWLNWEALKCTENAASQIKFLHLFELFTSYKSSQLKLLRMNQVKKEKDNQNAEAGNAGPYLRFRKPLYIHKTKATCIFATLHAIISSI